MPMSRLDRPLKVFVSSTSEDLTDYRAVARLAICDMKWAPDMMEHWTTRPESTREACFDELSKCDLMILMVAFRRGWVPTKDQGGDGQSSITALEYKYAQENNKPVLVFLAKDNWPGNLWERDPSAMEWIENFRNELNQIAKFFEYEKPAGDEKESFPVFRAEIRRALSDYLLRLIQDSGELEEPEPTLQPEDFDQFEGACQALQMGGCIPFLGPGIYGEEGPLSSCSIIEALADKKCLERTLATAAEYRERRLKFRDSFLIRLEKIINEQGMQTKEPVVFELLLKSKPALIVSATEDLLLEQRLEKANHPLLIFCHVIRSLNGKHDGKIIMFRGPNDPNPKFHDADSIALSSTKDTFIIYKPLGSPLLNRLINDDLKDDAIDTVVMTETDHLILLSRLENQSTRVPNAFSRYFQRLPLIFLGYPMDVWHYRLVGQVFRNSGETSMKPMRLAVRRTFSLMEKLSWRNLEVELLPMDPDELARKILDELNELAGKKVQETP